MINNIGFKGTYLIKPPGSDDTSREENMRLLETSLRATFNASRDPQTYEISKKHNGIYLDTEKNNNTSRTDFSEDDKSVLRTAILFFANSINRGNDREGTPNYREALENHLEAKLKNKNKKTFDTTQGAEKMPSIINLNLPLENKPLTSLQEKTKVVNLR